MSDLEYKEFIRLSGEIFTKRERKYNESEDIAITTACLMAKKIIKCCNHLKED